MDGNRIGAIIAFILLITLSVVIGNQISGSLTDSLWSFALIAAVVGCMALVICGKKSWPILLYVGAFVAHSHNGNATVYPLDGVLAVFFILYWLILFSLGRVRIKWCYVFGFDVLVLMIVIYTAISFYRFPAYVNLLSLGVDLDVDYIGGNVYVVALFAVAFYAFISLLDVQREKLENVLRWVFWIGIASEVLYIIKCFATGDMSGGTDEVDAAELGSTRLSLFYVIGVMTLSWLFAHYPLKSILLSPWRWAVGGLAFMGGGMSGNRSFLILSALNIGFMGIARRSAAGMAIVAIALWGGVLGLSQSGLMEKMPPTAQRMLAVLPGVSVDKAIESNTKASSDVRVEAWKLALDPRRGYIHDYVWGDGFQTSKAALYRHLTAVQRRSFEQGYSHGEQLARMRAWHNGFIKTMDHMGLAGCALFYTAFIYGLVVVIRVAWALPYNKNTPYVWIYLAFAFTFPFNYSYNARLPSEFFSMWLMPAAVLKLFYSFMIEEGRLRPFFASSKYEPLMLRQLKSDVNSSEHS